MVAAVMQEGLTRFKRGLHPTGAVSAPRSACLRCKATPASTLPRCAKPGAEAITVRRRAELDAVDGLVIPGGESTTMSHLLREFELLEPLRARLADGMPAYGSCAGMILLASEMLDAGVPGVRRCRCGGIDMTVRRNAFGRQVDSFEGDIAFEGLDVRCMRCSSGRRGWSGWATAVEVLARAAGHIVAVRQGSVLATAFHPEMTGDRRVHRLFVDMVNGRH